MAGCAVASCGREISFSETDLVTLTLLVKRHSSGLTGSHCGQCSRSGYIRRRPRRKSQAITFETVCAFRLPNSTNFQTGFLSFFLLDVVFIAATRSPPRLSSVKQPAGSSSLAKSPFLFHFTLFLCFFPSRSIDCRLQTSPSIAHHGLLLDLRRPRTIS